MAEPRRRRRVRRLLRRMERLDAVRPAGRSHRRAATFAGLLVVLLGVVSVAAMHGDDGSGSRFPDRPDDAQDARIEAPVTVGEFDDAFAFAQTQPGGADPVAYDPCVPIHLTVHPGSMVRDGMKMLEEALEEVRRATGLRFVVDGVVDEEPGDGLRASGAGGWRPVSVTWSDPEQTEELKGGVAGFAGSASVERDGRRWYVTGQVTLDGPQLDAILRGAGGWASARSVVMHELGHLVGLDHVDAPGQLMRPVGAETITSFAAGDLTGLAELGRGRCLPY